MKKYIFLLLALLMPLGALEARITVGYSTDGRWYFGASTDRRHHYRNDYYYYNYGRPYNYYYRNSYYDYPYQSHYYYNRYPYSYHRYRCDQNGNCRKVYVRYRYYY